MGELTPTQRKILDGIFAFDRPRTVFDDGLSARLRSTLEDGLADAAGQLGDGWITVGKYALDWVHRCEGLYESRESGAFEWTIPMLRGRVAHRAIEVAILHPGRPPLDVIDRAVERLIAGEEQDSVAEFLKNLPDIDLAALKAGANEAAAAFLSDWPPVDRKWTPRIESPVAARLNEGRIRLKGKYDLAFGRPNGLEARVIIVDFKTGDRRHSHVEDLRFYALLETLRTGTPPFRVASYYIEEGDFHVEDVTEAILDATVRRTIDGARKMIRRRAKDGDPALTPGAHCRWCPAREGCEPGAAYLASAGRRDEAEF